MSAIIYTLANYRAKKALRQQLQRHGVKVSSVPPRNLVDLSRMWFDIHRDECVADAWRMVHGDPVLRKMYEKEQRQRAKLTSDAQTPEPPISMGSAVQMSGAK
jgi:hypothetical protein